MVSLGHASFIGLAGYAACCCSTRAIGQLLCRDPRDHVLHACGALFGVLALRASGIGFLMITLALGQIVWGIAYRANTLTDGDNGLRYAGAARRRSASTSTARRTFYWFTLIVFAVALFFIWRLTRSPFGASPAGRARPAAPHAHARA